MIIKERLGKAAFFCGPKSEPGKGIEPIKKKPAQTYALAFLFL
jgi:hypothetical protein